MHIGCEFCSHWTLCHAAEQAIATATTAKPLGLGFRHALVAHAIAHRLPRPPDPSAVPWQGNVLVQAFLLTEVCELCAVIKPPRAPRPCVDSPPIGPVMPAATLIVGFNEEFMFRGILLHGFRQTGGEVHAWAWSTTLFALAHGMNLFAGEAIQAVMPQILNAFLLGALFYLTRRVSGSIWLAIVAHGFWDFAVLSHGGSGSDAVPGGGTQVLHLQNLVPLVVPVLFIVAMIAHNQSMHPNAEVMEPAQAK